MKKVIIYGENKNAKYHPLSNVQEEFKNILSKYDLVFTEKIEFLTYENLIKYDCFINYADGKNVPIDDDIFESWEKFVNNRGSIIIIHCGIVLKNEKYNSFVGAKFNGHPPMEKVFYYPVVETHPIIKDINGFEVEEELYRYEFINFNKFEVIMNGKLNSSGEIQPAIWLKEYKVGKLCYFQPGHNINTFKTLEIRKLLQNTVDWCCLNKE